MSCCCAFFTRTPPSVFVTCCPNSLLCTCLTDLLLCLSNRGRLIGVLPSPLHNNNQQQQTDRMGVCGSSGSNGVVVDLLKPTPLGQRLTHEQLTVIARYFRLRKYEKGSNIFVQVRYYYQYVTH